MGAIEPATRPLPDKPSIAVLPLHNMSSFPEQEYCAVVELSAIAPMIVPMALPYRDLEHRELYLSGLRPALGEGGAA